MVIMPPNPDDSDADLNCPIVYGPLFEPKNTPDEVVLPPLAPPLSPPQKSAFHLRFRGRRPYEEIGPISSPKKQ
jgi:hypothetical protein